MKKIKIDTIVKIRTDLEGNTYSDNLWVNEHMTEYRGQEFKVATSFWNTTRNQNEFTLEGVDWTWNLSMIEEVSEENMEEFEDLKECYHCGEEHSEEDLIYVDYYDRWVCQDCYDNYYSVCEDCNEVYYCDDLHSVEGGNRCVCDSCMDNYYYCAECNEYYYSDSMYYDEETDEWYCEDCWNNRPQHRIYGYHQYPRPFEFYKASGEEKPPFYIGAELEVENDEVVDECLDHLYDNLDLMCSRDGSLCGNGAMEMVFDPRTPKSWYESADKLKVAYKMLVDNGYRSNDTSSCGLHFHVSRPYQEEINKLDYYNDEDRKKIEELKEKQEEFIDRTLLVLETYKEPLIKFSRRKDNTWCKWLSDVVTCDNGKITSLDYIKKVKGESYGHHRALNLENRNTIEFRIFKGTLNFNTFMASLELVNNITTLCSDLSLPITKIDWNKLTRGEYISQYVEERGIKCTKKIVDTSASDRIWELIRNKRKVKVVKKITNELEKYYNHYTSRFNEIKDSEDWNTIYHTASKLSEFSCQMEQITRYNNEKDYNGLFYKIQETIRYNMYFDNEYLEGIKNNLMALNKELQ